MKELYNKAPIAYQQGSNRSIPVFLKATSSEARDEKKATVKNIDQDTVDSFGEEWAKFHDFDLSEIQAIAEGEYFDIVTDEILDKESIALDIGCGSGRWTYYVSQRAKHVYSIDPSQAILAADHLLKGVENVSLCQASLDDMPFADEQFDFAFCLGVLHHVPDTAEGLKACVRKVKKGGYFLVYLYYALDGRGPLYRGLFRIVNVFRKGICRLPATIKQWVCDGIALTVYWPLARFSALLKSLGFQGVADRLPLSYYSDKSFFVMRNDALDRFGTPLEQRYSKLEVAKMMRAAGLKNITFSENAPFWHAVGQRAVES